MKLMYEVHYTQGDVLDYRSFRKYCVAYDQYDRAQALTEQLKREGANPVIVVKPYFTEQ